MLTHDEKFDVPALIAALDTPAVYIGAMGSKVTTADREVRLRAEGVDDAGIARIHAPIGLAIGARSPKRWPLRSAPRSSRRPLSPAAARRTRAVP